MSKRVLFRVDSGSQLGIGHVRRCASLANALNEIGFECVFVCLDLPQNISDYLKARGFLVYFITGYAKEFGWTVCESDQHLGLGEKIFKQADWLATSKITDVFKPDLLVVDHYFLDKTWEEKFKKRGITIVAIDDLANRPHDCDIIIDQNYFGSQVDLRYESLVPNDCIKLLGPSHAIIEKEYSELSKSKKVNNDVKKVLISLGGSDPTNATSLVLELLLESQMAHLNFDVVLGPSNVFHKEIEKQTYHVPNVKIHRAPDSLLKLMSESDVVIGAGGSSIWERMTLGIPSLVIGIAENQVAICQRLAADGLIIYVGKSNEISASHFIREFEHLVNSSLKRKNMAAKNKEIVNGAGAQKVAMKLESYLNSKIV